jgi:hypothetical protein
VTVARIGCPLGYTLAPLGCVRTAGRAAGQDEAAAKVVRPALSCPNGGRLEPVGLVCIGDGPAGVAAGYAPCPTGMKPCPLTAWARPICAAQDRLFGGVEACGAFEVLALAHKLPKVACPAA